MCEPEDRSVQSPAGPFGRMLRKACPGLRPRAADAGDHGGDRHRERCALRPWPSSAPMAPRSTAASPGAWAAAGSSSTGCSGPCPRRNHDAPGPLRSDSASDTIAISGWTFSTRKIAKQHPRELAQHSRIRSRLGRLYLASAVFEQPGHEVDIVAVQRAVPLQAVDQDEDDLQIGTCYLPDLRRQNAHSCGQVGPHFANLLFRHFRDSPLRAWFGRPPE